MTNPTPLALLLIACLAATTAPAQAPEQAPLPEEAERPAVTGETPAADTEDAPAPAPVPTPEAAAEAQAPADAAEANPAPVPRVQPPPSEAQRDHEPDESESTVAPPEAGPEEGDLAACEAALAGLDARFQRAEPLTGEAPCGAASPITLSAVGGIELRPAPTVRCPVAEALALWVRRVAAPMADVYLETSLRAVLIGTDYQCRRRRGDGTAKYSEHAFANAVDVMGVVFEDGTPMPVKPRDGSAEAERAYQAAVRGGACAFFTTVLGPTTNASHADHLHLDMAQRRGGYRLCE